jgi:NAD(P)-dependent dehydrogenase (short-subunit alcohol dehydrogenase family)
VSPARPVEYKVWLVTGSSRGLGRALAQAVAASGDRLVATARHPGTLNDLIMGRESQVLTIELDVTDVAQARSALQATVDAFGRVDVIVNNAGYANVSSIEDFREDDMRAQVETNLWGVVNVTRAALPFLRAQRDGHVIQISSIGGRITGPGLAPYQMAKWAVEGFSGALRKEVAPFGVRVTVVEPGGIRTDWAGSSMTIHEVSEDYAPSVGVSARRMEASGPGSSLGDPVKMARAILQVARMDDPPEQLVLGSDALLLARRVEEARLRELARWEELSLSTDYDSGPGNGPDPAYLQVLS